VGGVSQAPAPLNRVPPCPALVQNQYAIRHLAHHREIVADEDERQPKPLPKIGQQIQYLRLDRQIQRRNGFVGNQKFWAQRQGPGDGDALFLAPGKLVGIMEARIRRQTHFRQASSTAATIPLRGPFVGEEVRPKEFPRKVLDLAKRTDLEKPSARGRPIPLEKIRIGVFLPKDLASAGGQEPRQEARQVVLPDPDSPTSPKDSPTFNETETPSNARTSLRRV
jgi:hypothetical protein